jgi:AraC family transcriptional regulator of adaptative response/methylated-DNA-[protein]-cysteine methyltransferase
VSTNRDSLKTYTTVAAAIRFLRANADRQPGLDELAAHVGLSPFHLQRLFSRWAGISPKRFVQYLTKEHARRSLLQSRDVLAASLAAGLSGAGRLHDLMISCEAVTPGQLGAGGEGLTIHHGFAATPLGEIAAGLTPRGVCHLRFVDADGPAAATAALRRDWPRAVFIRDDAGVAGLADRLFGAAGALKPLSLLLKGTNFQLKVWEALLHVPPGSVIAYSDLAALAGSPRACRAVGTAMARNPIAVLIPCHRVIRENGEFGQYRWGSERKGALLAWEQARTAVPDSRATDASGRPGRARR